MEYTYNLHEIGNIYVYKNFIRRKRMKEGLLTIRDTDNSKEIELEPSISGAVAGAVVGGTIGGVIGLVFGPK